MFESINIARKETWIITNASGSGLTKFASNIIENNISKHIYMIGIASWKKILSNQTPETARNYRFSLNKYHSHFLFVDTEDIQQMGKDEDEIVLTFRERFEDLIIRTYIEKSEGDIILKTSQIDMANDYK